MIGTVQNIASKVTEAVKGGVTHTEQYEGVQEEGLRMLMFGKPGSGKVSSFIHSFPFGKMLSMWSADD